MRFLSAPVSFKVVRSHYMRMAAAAHGPQTPKPHGHCARMKAADCTGTIKH